MEEVDDGPQPERVEIELTPSDSAHERMQPDLEPTGVEPPARSESETRRLVAVALVTGLIALALGWMLGRSSSESTTLERPVTSTTASPTETTIEELEGDPIPAVEDAAPATTAGAAPTTTDPEVFVGVVSVHSGVAGQPIELVGTSSGGHLVTLDLATGELRRHTDRRFGSDEFDPIFAGPDWLAVAQPDQSELLVLRDGHEPERVAFGDVWELLRVPRTDRFWHFSDTDGGPPFGSRFYEEISLRDGPTGRRVEVAGAELVLPDPAGALVGSRAGKAYTIDADGASHLGDGELLAIGLDVALFRNCDETMRCYLAVLDRSSGALTRLSTEQRFVDGITPAFWGYLPSLAPSVSPSGGHSVIRPFVDDEPATAILDLRSGVVTTLTAADDPPFTAIAWSDDGRFVFYTDGTVPMAWDAETGATFAIAEVVSDWYRLTVRSSASSPPA
jgi:hypothetical protein